MEAPGYRYNPNYIPEPKFIPGYGGHLPRTLTEYGMSYGNTSHLVLRSEPHIAARLAPLGPPRTEKSDPLDCKCNVGLESHKKGIISSKEDVFIPDYVCPGYTGCLTLKKKGLPINSCCGELLRSLGCNQDPCRINENEIEDPFPGPPKKIVDYTQEQRRCEDGMWKRYPRNYTVKEVRKWM